MTGGSSNAVKENLMSRVCILAGTSLHRVTPKAAAFLERRAKKWMQDRQATDSDVQKAAEDLRRRYPDAISPPPHARAASPQHAASRPAALPQSTPGANASSKSASANGNADRLRRSAASVPLTQTSAAAPADAGRAQSPSSSPPPPGGVAWHRPTVQRRLQAVAANKAWEAALQSDVAAFEQEQRDAREARLAKKMAIRSDMAAAEATRLQREAEARREREENRLAVARAMDEAQAFSQAQVDARRAKFVAEKQFIVEQLARRAAVKDSEERARVAENERARRQAAADIARHEAETYEKAVAVRDSLLEFLQESTEFLHAKRRAAEEEKRREREADGAQIRSGLAALDAGAEGRVATLPGARKVRAQQALQQAVAEKYATVQAETAAKAHEANARLRAQADAKAAEADAREAAEAAFRQQQRRGLLVALSEGTAVRERRRAEREAEKARQRELADKDAALHAEEQRASRLAHAEQQHALLKRLDLQVEQSMERLTRPPEMKIK